jgi:hypothetical protein
MEIAPIPGIRTLSPMTSSRLPSGEPSVLDIGASQRPGDGKEKGSARKAAGSQEEDEGEEYELEFEGDSETGTETSRVTTGKSIDYFA